MPVAHIQSRMVQNYNRLSIDSLLLFFDKIE